MHCENMTRKPSNDLMDGAEAMDGPRGAKSREKRCLYLKKFSISSHTSTDISTFHQKDDLDACTPITMAT